MSKILYTTTVVIPTKNRPFDLTQVLESIFYQSVIPNDIVIVDQSNSTDSKLLSIAIFQKFNFTNYNYVHDVLISGLVEAKKVGVSFAKSDLIFFLEDDVILDFNYIEEIIYGFSCNSNMIGCSGVIKNHPVKSNIHKYFFNLFHIGIFQDKRFNIYANAHLVGNSRPLIISDKLSGGVSVWKSNVFSHVQFDLLNDFHMLEDIDFSTRVTMKLGPYLYINPNAKLVHNFAISGRASLLVQKRRKVRECIVYYKKRTKCKHAFLSIGVLIIGMFLNALIESISLKSLDSLRGFFMGVSDGIFFKIRLIN